MRKKILVTIFTLMLTVGLSYQGAQAANLIQNGSFESPVTSYINGPTNTLDSWSVDNGNIDILNNSYWQAEDGSQSIDLTGTLPGTISQSFSTIASQMYEVSFYLSGNPDNSGPLQKTVDVLINNINKGSFTYDRTLENNTYSNMNWKKQSFTFTADSSLSTLAFSTQNGNYSGPALDNVNVSPVPEPSTMLLGLLTLAGGFFTRRRKK